MAFDVMKGLLILGVLAIHAVGRASSKFTTEQSAFWYELRSISWFLQFCVPSFLFASAVLWSQSQTKRDSYKGYFKRRMLAVLYPFVLWTFIYWGLKLLAQGNPADLATITQTSYGVTLTGPKFFVDLPARFHDLMWGKASFHLYFMSVLLQFVLVFPVFYWLLKKTKLNFLAAVGIGIGLQAIVFTEQRNLQLFKYPASTFTWYLLVLIPGIWIGMNMEQWMKIRRWVALGGLALSIPTGIWYQLFERQIVLGDDVPSMPYNWALALFGLGMPLLVLTISQEVGKLKILKPIAWLGVQSLGLYLVHLIVLDLLSRPRVIESFAKFKEPAIMLYATMTLISCGVVALLTVPLEGPLFGKFGSKPKPSG